MPILSEEYAKIRVAKETETGEIGTEIVAEITDEEVTPATGYQVILTPNYNYKDK